MPEIETVIWHEGKRYAGIWSYTEAVQKEASEATVRKVSAWLRAQWLRQDADGIHTSDERWGDATGELLADEIESRFLSAPAAEADPRMAAIAYGQSDEYRERFLREKQPPSPTEPPADDWCKCPIKTKGEITLTYHPIGGHAAPLLDGFRCQHCNRRVEAFHKAAPASKVCEWEYRPDLPYLTGCGIEVEYHGGSPAGMDCPNTDCGLPVSIKPADAGDTP